MHWLSRPTSETACATDRLVVPSIRVLAHKSPEGIAFLPLRETWLEQILRASLGAALATSSVNLSPHISETIRSIWHATTHLLRRGHVVGGAVVEVSNLWLD